MDSRTFELKRAANYSGYRNIGFLDSRYIINLINSSFN